MELTTKELEIIERALEALKEEKDAAIKEELLYRIKTILRG